MMNQLTHVVNTCLNNIKKWQRFQNLSLVHRIPPNEYPTLDGLEAEAQQCFESLQANQQENNPQIETLLQTLVENCVVVSSEVSVLRRSFDPGDESLDGSLGIGLCRVFIKKEAELRPNHRSKTKTSTKSPKTVRLRCLISGVELRDFSAFTLTEVELRQVALNGGGRKPYQKVLDSISHHQLLFRAHDFIYWEENGDWVFEWAKNPNATTRIKQYPFFMGRVALPSGVVFEVRLSSAPFILTTNTNQNLDAWMALLWEAAFTPNPGPVVSVNQFITMLSSMFKMHSEIQTQTGPNGDVEFQGRGLDPDEVAFIKTKLNLPSGTSCLSYRDLASIKFDFVACDSGKDVKESFSKWIFEIIRLLHDPEIRTLWLCGLLRLCSHLDCVSRISQSPFGTFTLRFSLSVLRAVTPVYVGENLKIMKVNPFVRKDSSCSIVEFLLKENCLQFFPSGWNKGACLPKKTAKKKDVYQQRLAQNGYKDGCPDVSVQNSNSTPVSSCSASIQEKGRLPSIAIFGLPTSLMENEAIPISSGQMTENASEGFDKTTVFQPELVSVTEVTSSIPAFLTLN